MHARRLPARHGMLWLVAGFALYRRHPPLLTGLTFGYLLLVLLLNVLPFAGPILLSLVLPGLTAMLGNGCRAIDQRKPFVSEMLTFGVLDQRRPFLKMGGLHLAGSALLVLLAALLNVPTNFDSNMSEAAAIDLARDVSLLLLAASPLLMAFWFAPLLLAWDKLPPLKAIFFSFVASWRNWRAFTVYGGAVVLFGVMMPGLLIVAVGLAVPPMLSIASLVMRFLLIAVLAPVMMASIYLSYRDVFHAPPRIDG